MQKVLTVCQPYAWLLLEQDPFAEGRQALKRIENRTWPTDYRGPLWIHAGKSRAWMDSGLRDCHSFGVEVPEQFAFGELLGRVELVDCRRRSELPRELLGRWDAEGPWCWVASGPRWLLEPRIELRGRQGIFGVPDRLLAGAELERVCPVCGCTDQEGCPEGCWWVAADLCSSCQAEPALPEP